MLLVAVSCAAWSEDFEKGVAASENKDYATALVHFEAAAAEGNAGEQSNLGVMYEEGHGVEQDYKKAVHWYTLAAKQGDAVAQLFLAFMYAHGNVSKKIM